MGFASGCERIFCAACRVARVIFENDCNNAVLACDGDCPAPFGAVGASDLCSTDDRAEYGFGLRFG